MISAGMFNETIDQAHKTAIAASIAASEWVLKYWPNPTNPYFEVGRVMTVFEKGNGVGNYATVADLESEDIIVTKIKAEPLLEGHYVVTEESADIVTESEYRWIIDPIDGTIPFKNGLPEFAISIGLIKGAEPVVGVVALPAQRQLIAAKRGQGGSLLSFDGKTLSVLNNLRKSPPTSLDKVLVGYDVGYEQRGKQLRELVAKIADKVNYLVSYGSSSTIDFRLAQGLIDAHIFLTPEIFDIGASSVIIEESGGVVTDINGEEINWLGSSRSYLVARTPEIHQQLLEMIHS